MRMRMRGFLCLRLGPRLILERLVSPLKLHDSLDLNRSAGFILNVSLPSPRKSSYLLDANRLMIK